MLLAKLVAPCGVLGLASAEGVLCAAVWASIEEEMSMIECEAFEAWRDHVVLELLVSMPFSREWAPTYALTRMVDCQEAWRGFTFDPESMSMRYAAIVSTHNTTVH